MSAALYTDLAWLPPAVDFNASWRRLRGETGALGASLRRLASHALSEPQLRRLAHAIGALRAEGRSLAPLVPFKLAVLSNATVDITAPALVASAARHGVALECIIPGYGQSVQGALSAHSELNRAGCDAVLIALDHRGLPLHPDIADAAAAEASLQASLDLVRAIRETVHATGALCIVQTLAAPPETLFGHFDRRHPATLHGLIEAFNRQLAADLAESRDALFDVETLAATVGLAEWHSPVQWNLAKLPFASACLPLYADHVGRIVGALCGKSRRALVLDLDNTLWGGVIGDDGLAGILLGQGDGTGEAFLSVQRMALDLRRRGVVLAVSSKNNDETARAPFRDHSEMMLREEHIAVFQANWTDKATNIRAIAAELSLGLDSLVFLDDNPAERALVRRELPETAVPELPDDPALYARTLAAAGYFEAVVFSAEDLERAASYQANARRAALREQTTSVDGFLASLQMEITLQPFSAVGRKRIAQLIGKSNQFNLTSRRYTEAEVEWIAADPAVFTLQVRLSDIFGDSGMISVAICRPLDAESWEIDTWLMSCRVLGRGVERMVLREILQAARARGVKRVVGVYKQTGRNGLVADHYPALGFSPLPNHTPTNGGDGEEAWELSTDAEVAPAPMTLRVPSVALRADA